MSLIRESMCHIEKGREGNAKANQYEQHTSFIFFLEGGSEKKFLLSHSLNIQGVVEEECKHLQS